MTIDSYKITRHNDLTPYERIFASGSINKLTTKDLLKNEGTLLPFLIGASLPFSIFFFKRQFKDDDEVNLSGEKSKFGSLSLGENGISIIEPDSRHDVNASEEPLFSYSPEINGVRLLMNGDHTVMSDFGSFISLDLRSPSTVRKYEKFIYAKAGHTEQGEYVITGGDNSGEGGGYVNADVTSAIYAFKRGPLIITRRFTQAFLNEMYELFKGNTRLCFDCLAYFELLLRAELTKITDYRSKWMETSVGVVSNLQINRRFGGFMKNIPDLFIKYVLFEITDDRVVKVPGRF